MDGGWWMVVVMDGFDTDREAVRGKGRESTG